MAKWLPPNGFTGKVHHLDAKVGGSYKMSFSNFTSGKSHSFGGTYRELTPHDSTIALRLAEPGASVTVRDKNSAVEYMG